MQHGVNQQRTSGIRQAFRPTLAVPFLVPFFLLAFVFLPGARGESGETTPRAKPVPVAPAVVETSDQQPAAGVSAYPIVDLPVTDLSLTNHQGMGGPTARAQSQSVVAQAGEPVSLTFPSKDFLQVPTCATSEHRRVLGFEVPIDFRLLETGQRPGGAAYAVLDWPQLRTIMRTATQNGQQINHQGATLATTSVFLGAGSAAPTQTAEQALSGFADNSSYRLSSAIEEIALPMDVKGGTVSGTVQLIKGRAATFLALDATVSPDQDPKCQAAGGCRRVQDGLIVVLDWGVGPAGAFESLDRNNRQRGFLILIVINETVLSTTDSTVIPLNDPDLIATLGEPSPADYNQSVLTAYRQQIESGQLRMRGAVPEWLFLYDFTGRSTVAPETVAYVNQYDAGLAAGLPIRYGSRGGNACGPSVLAMAMDQIDAPIATLSQIYSNTLTKPTAEPPSSRWQGEFSQSFLWPRAEAWLNGAVKYDTDADHLSETDEVFSPTIPLPPTFSAVFDNEDTWENIEANLAAHRPVLLSTNLSTGGLDPQGNLKRSNGHVVMLMGTGRNDYVGDYYVVADAAGHYFANATQGGHNKGHYGQVAQLQRLCLGLNHGGWFAIYPKSEFRARAVGPRTLTLNPLLPHLSVDVQSPVTLLMTDPQGRRTGVLTDGTVLQEIPNSAYRIGVAEEQESGTVLTFPDGPKTVTVDTPERGLYRVELTGTSSGDFTLSSLSLGAGGVFQGRESRSSPIQPGEQKIYFYEVEDTYVQTICQPVAPDGSAPITRLPTCGDGTQGNGQTSEPAFSADGRYLAFTSHAKNLVRGDVNAGPDVFVYDRREGDLDRVSVSSTGITETSGCGNCSPPVGSHSPSLSADGRYVAFSSSAINLIPGPDANGFLPDIFIRDRQTKLTERVSISSAGEQAKGGSYGPSISADGRYVAFVSGANNLTPGDTDTKWDIFVRDRQTGTTERVVANDYEIGVSISADGRFLVFYSGASDLVPNDTNGKPDIFVHDRQTHLTKRVSASSTGEQADAESRSPSISADGRYVAFASRARNLAPVGASVLNAFVHDLQTGTTEQVNVSSNGEPADQGAIYHGTSISGDGRYVAFPSSSTNLVPGDTNGEIDIFVRDRQTGTTERVSFSTAGGQANGEQLDRAGFGPLSFSPTISTYGRNLAFVSLAGNLVPDDTNGVYDVFVVRLGAADTITSGQIYLPLIAR